MCHKNEKKLKYFSSFIYNLKIYNEIYKQSCVPVTMRLSAIFSEAHCGKKINAENI